MRRLLIVEDDGDSASMLAMLLESGGYAVTVVHEISEARRAMEHSAFDLVIADLVVHHLPIDDCWADVDTLVELARPARVGILTGWKVSDGDLAKHDLAFILTKPSRRDELFAALAASLSLAEVSEDLATRIHAYFSALEQGSYGTLGALCTEDVLYRVPGSDPRFANEIRGRAPFVAFAEKTFQGFSEPHFQVRSVRPLPAGAVVEYAGTWSSDGETRSMPGAVMFECRDGEFCRIDVRLPVEAVS